MTAAAVIEGVDPSTRKSTPFPVGPNGAYAFGQIFPGEDTTISRIAVSLKSACAHYIADGVIKAAPGMLVAIYVFNATANDDFVIYDNASAASGTKLIDALNVPAGYTGLPSYPAAAANGMYLDITTAGAMQLEICYL